MVDARRSALELSLDREMPIPLRRSYANNSGYTSTYGVHHPHYLSLLHPDGDSASPSLPYSSHGAYNLRRSRSKFSLHLPAKQLVVQTLLAARVPVRAISQAAIYTT
ncbi:hypothetical protein LIA77_09859 [Sarocladium implicatum]|nr:hypothetical protein LIA77_09859 [Sarocladium implicatum]